MPFVLPLILQMQSHLLFIVISLTFIIYSIAGKKLTISAAVTAAIVGSLIYTGTGFNGIWLIGIFFLLGIATTAWKRKHKEQFRLVEPDIGRRNALQVLANGGVAGLLGSLAYLKPEYESLLLLMMACSLSSATADTVSSELGMVYGKRFYNILSFRKDTRGENGVVSLEGTLFGLAGSLTISMVYFCSTGLYEHIIIIVIAGTIGNLIDSILGATLERKGIISNNTVNFLNTLTGALVALICLLNFF
jgi:uncharacterized protein (TIGR00297 family)